MTTALTVSECDVAVIGGGLGGVAAALGACRSGVRVCLTEETPWIGGQATSQGVSAPDEHDHIETFGATAIYYEFREAIRAQYRQRYRLSEGARAAPSFNPGDGWVSRLCFEPSVGVLALVGMLLPQIEAGRLQILYKTRPVAAARDGDTITSVTVEGIEAQRTEIRATWFLDATELGDLLPLADVPWVTGAESRQETGEPDARPDGPAPQLTQTWTMPFVVEVCPGENHTITRPDNYERMRDEQIAVEAVEEATADEAVGADDRRAARRPAEAEARVLVKGSTKLKALYPFKSPETTDKQTWMLPEMQVDEILTYMGDGDGDNAEDWYKVISGNGIEGLVPKTYLEEAY